MFHSVDSSELIVNLLVGVTFFFFLTDCDFITLEKPGKTTYERRKRIRKQKILENVISPWKPFCLYAMENS